MIGTPGLQSFERLLIHAATISGRPVSSVPAGKTESVTTYPSKVADVSCNVQAMSGRDRLLGAGLDENATHRIWFVAGTDVLYADLIKATSGPFAGNYYRVVFLENFDHHLEVKVQLDDDAKKDDPL